MSSEDSNSEISGKTEGDSVGKVGKTLLEEKTVLEEKLFELNKKFVIEKNERRKKQYEAEIKKIQEQISSVERRYEILSGMYIVNKARAEFWKSMEAGKNGLSDSWATEMHKNSMVMSEGVSMMTGGCQEEMRSQAERKKQKEKGIKYKVLQMLKDMHVIKRK